MYCHKCSKKIATNVKYCPFCGAKPTKEKQGHLASHNDNKNELLYSSYSIISLVCAVISFFIPLVGILLAIVAIVLAKKAKNNLPKEKKAMAVAGFVIGIISLVIGCILLVVLLVSYAFR